MKKALLVGMLFSVIFICHGLSSYGDTPDFVLDTIAPQVQLLTPNGGENWYIGDTQDILWEASDTNLLPEGITLLYSLNGAANFTYLAEALANSGSYAWLLPSSQSNNAKVQVQAMDSFGNMTQVSSLSSFSITYVPPASPSGLLVNLDNGIDAILAWDAVTQTIPPYNSPITPDGYIILYNETPYEDDQYYYFLGRSFTTSYTHHDVAEFRTQMFYRVKAYKNYSREEEDALESLVQKSKLERVSWSRAKSILKSGGDR
jgi:hypothetical protein